MASNHPSEPRTQELRIKFLINIPMKVDSEADAKNTCRRLLDSLREGFREEDQSRLRDIAVVFGMNGKHTEERVKVLKKLQKFKYVGQEIRHSVITYTWGTGGEIAQSATHPPYQDIREYLKNNAATLDLLRELRSDGERSLVYFSFVDSDTFSFNYIYSEYLRIVSKEVTEGFDPPTVMSTGYEFTHEKQYHIASDLDKMIRQAVAEVEPLLVYYPEPNFCVLVDDGCDGIKESFIKPKRRKGENHMESPVLIRQVKERPNFKAVFPEGKPIIIGTPERFTLRGQGLKTGQSTLDGMNLAKGITCNGLLTNKEAYSRVGPNTSAQTPGVTGLNRGFIIHLFYCESDKEFEELSKKNPYSRDGKEATEVVEAVKQARVLRKFIEEFDQKASLS